MSQWLLSRGSAFLVEADSGRGKSYMCAFFFFNLLLSFETIRGTLMVMKKLYLDVLHRVWAAKMQNHQALA